jgi:hypothetical protein
VPIQAPRQPAAPRLAIEQRYSRPCFGPFTRPRAAFDVDTAEALVFERDVKRRKIIAYPRGFIVSMAAAKMMPAQLPIFHESATFFNSKLNRESRQGLALLIPSFPQSSPIPA